MTRVAPHAGGEPAAIVGGTLEMTSSLCVLLSGRPVVWPAGTQPIEDGAVLPGGVTAVVGDEVSGGGGYIPTGAREVLDRLVREDLAAFSDCLRESNEVALFVAEAEDGDMKVVHG